MDWQALFTTLGSVGVGAAALVWLVKGLVQQAFTRDTERFKTQLQAAHDTELERLRADLRISSFESETRFARLHEKRAEVIAELYKKLVAAENTVQALIRRVGGAGLGFRSEVEVFDEAVVATANFFVYYDENKIYFDETLCSKLQEFHEHLQSIWLKYVMHKIERVPPEKVRRDFAREWEPLIGQIPHVRVEIMKAFRELLGLKQENRVS